MQDQPNFSLLIIAKAWHMSRYNNSYQGGCVRSVMESAWSATPTCGRAPLLGFATSATMARIRAGLINSLLCKVPIFDRCVICGGPGISDAYYCKECTVQVLFGAFLSPSSWCVSTSSTHVCSPKYVSFTKWRNIHFSSWLLYLLPGKGQRWVSKDCQPRQQQDRLVLWDEKVWVQKEVKWPKGDAQALDGLSMFLWHFLCCGSFFHQSCSWLDIQGLSEFLRWSPRLNDPRSWSQTKWSKIWSPTIRNLQRKPRMVT